MYLSNHISQKNKIKKGFTLIELLIVIAILGILAAGLLAALDPIEQINKGRDTSRKQVAVQLAGALQRYYATYEKFPWGSGPINGISITSGAGATYISSLTAAGELKSSFLSGIASGVPIVLIGQAVTSGADVYVCFNPASKSMNSERTSIFSSTSTNPPATDPAICPNASNVCFFCAR